MRNKGCSIDRCNNSFYAKGLCRNHYIQQRKVKSKRSMVRLHTHLKRMVNKAHVMGYTVEQVHKSIDEILYKYGVRDKLPKKGVIGK